MKKLNVLFLSLVALAVTVTSCTKNETPAAAPATELDLTIKDQSKNPVAGVKVILFSDSKFTVKVDSVTTTATGIAKFNKNLKSQIYYFTANTSSPTCLTNYFTSRVTGTTDSSGNFTASAIPANQTTPMDVEVVAAGSIVLTNSSQTDSYNIYAGLTPAAGGTTQYTKITTFIPLQQGQLPVMIGSYDLKFTKVVNNLEVSGSDILKPANVVTACGSVSVSFP